MKTMIINIPDKEENFFITLMKKIKFKNRILTDEEAEEMQMAKWIDEGMESEDIPIEKVYNYMRKHGVDC